MLNTPPRSSSRDREIEQLEDPLLPVEKKDELSSRTTFGNAGICSRVTFSWLNQILKKGRSQKIALSDIPSIPRSETAESSFLSLEPFIKSQKNGEFSLSISVFSMIWKSLALNAVFAGISTVAAYIGPYLITYFIRFLTQESHEKRSHGYYGIALAFIFFFSKTIESLTLRQWNFGAQRIGIRVKAALTALLYQKSLSVKSSTSDNGKIVNMINTDIDRVGDFCLCIHNIWLLPLQVILALLILCENLGPGPSFVAILSTVLVTTTNIPLARFQRWLQSRIMDAKDSRIKATSESVKNIRVLKLQSWETAFLDKIVHLREKERTWVSRYLCTCAFIAFLFWVSPIVVSVITFGVCLILKTPLTSGTVFSALATFTALREPIYNIPELISTIAQTKVSVDRIQEYLNEEDREKLNQCNAHEGSGTAIELEIGEYAWDLSDQNPTIRISTRMEIMKGQKVAICGQVGSGKSSFLCSMLGEISRISGSPIKIYGTKAYVPQSAWIQTGTIQENVVFGREMDEGFYKRVMEGCALIHDIETLANGDMSIVGERGLNLSGGQKQRIQLARAVYNDSDVYILDDPFSAVDAHTGAHLFKKCLKGLLSGKTLVYATHQLEFLTAADIVLVIKDGEIVQSGKYEDLILDQEGELIRQINAHRRSLDQVSLSREGNFSSQPCEAPKHELTVEKAEELKKNDKLSERSIQEEETESGRVKWKVYSKFISTAYRGALVPVILLCQIFFQVLQMSSSYWIAWATEERNRVSNKKLIKTYAFLSAGVSIFILGRAVSLAAIAIETAQRLFLGMIKSVFRAPLSFYDTTPSSRILSRFTSDQTTLDLDIPFRVAGLAFALIQLISVVALMSYVAWEVFLLFLVVIGISICYQGYYISTARELARMVPKQKSPIGHHFFETVMGAATIRCFNQEDRFTKKILQVTDDLSRAAFHNFAAMEWLSMRINFLFNFVFLVALVILVSLPESAIDPSFAGLAATYGLSMNVLQAWVIWNMCNVENKMISVERILQYTDIPSEAPLVIENCKPEPEWPIEGRIELEDLHVQYSPSLPIILKGITCTFPEEKKIGIVGRTGSGKSTLIQAIFRTIEPLRGRIVIDGLDISQIGLQDLRSSLGIIPQDPTLFKGTVRSNVDPLEQHSDHEIWEVLRKCRLADVIAKDQMRLDTLVAESGENWSIGQRQLVCLARALLKKRRILVLDEATASVDTATDNMIQETMRTETSKCTVITVAHRIATVMDNDLILFLDEGRVIEYDSPGSLLENPDSAFSSLVAEFLKRSAGSIRTVNPS